jgi:hypothetical protein
MAQMKKTPINDFFAKNGKIREDGRMVHDMYLMQVKKPAESKSPGTTTTCRQVIPARRPSSRWPSRVPAGQEVSKIDACKTPGAAAWHDQRARGGASLLGTNSSHGNLRHPDQACSASCCSG